MQTIFRWKETLECIDLRIRNFEECLQNLQQYDAFASILDKDLQDLESLIASKDYDKEEVAVRLTIRVVVEVQQIIIFPIDVYYLLNQIVY